MSGVPYTFASATSSIPLSELDTNFATPVTIGTTSVTLGNTVTTLANVALANVTISSVASGIPNNFLANSSVTIGNTSVALGNTVTSLGNVTLTNVTIQGGTSNVSTNSIVNGTSNVSIASANGAVTMVTNGNTAVTIDTSQNVGVGVTPSAWVSTQKAIQIGASGSINGGTNTSQVLVSSNRYYNGTNDIYINTNYAAAYQQLNGVHSWYTAASGTAGNAITFTQAMTLSNSSYLQTGSGYNPGGSYHALTANNSGTFAIFAGSSYSSGATNNFSAAIANADTTGANTASASVLYLQKNGGTGRSLNAAGTVNQSGADYAEYMTKAGDFIINKGDVCGIDVNGKLTNVFANAISFVVKSTNPGLVGGDTWGSHLTAPTKPTEPTRKDESDEQWATIEANYQTELTQYNTALSSFNADVETARALVDRIAFSGQVPVNVTGASAGQYIVPVAKQDGSIGGEAVSESAMTLQQYMQSVGKVISVVNNLTTIIVKVA